MENKLLILMLVFVFAYSYPILTYFAIYFLFDSSKEYKVSMDSFALCVSTPIDNKKDLKSPGDLSSNGFFANDANIIFVLYLLHNEKF